MQDAEFFDHLFQVFARTTGAENTYWMPEKNAEMLNMGWFEPEPYIDSWSVYAMDQEQNKTLVGVFTKEVDADFITAVHGCMPDLVRRLHDALDEADRLDTARDEREQQIGRLAVENMELREECARLEEVLATARSKAADVLWKIERPM